MKPSKVSTLLAHMLPAGYPLLLTGAPGIGKTDLVSTATAACGYDLVLSHPVVSDPTDAKGLPWPDAATGTARFLPLGEIAELLNVTRPTTWFLDDLGQAPAATQAGYMQWLLARRVNGHRLPDCVTIVAATNRRQDRAGVTGILEPVKSRFAAIVQVEADLDDWCAWAIGANLPIEVVAFLRYRGSDLLCANAPTAEIENGPCPRTWANLAKLVTLNLPPALQLEAFAGAVGKGAATEFFGFLQMFGSLATADSILLAPDTAPIPDKPSALYATATALASKVNHNTLGRIVTYCERLVTAGKGEFATLCVRDCQRRAGDAAIAAMPDYTRAMCGPLGKLIRGED